MAACIECLDALSFDDILNLVTICDENMNRAFRLKQVSFVTPCSSCTGNYNGWEDIIRKSLWCDENGVWYVQVVIT